MVESSRVESSRLGRRSYLNEDGATSGGRRVFCCIPVGARGDGWMDGMGSGGRGQAGDLLRPDELGGHKVADDVACMRPLWEVGC